MLIFIFGVDNGPHRVMLEVLFFAVPSLPPSSALYQGLGDSPDRNSNPLLWLRDTEHFVNVMCLPRFQVGTTLYFVEESCLCMKQRERMPGFIKRRNTAYRVFA